MRAKVYFTSSKACRTPYSNSQTLNSMSCTAVHKHSACHPEVLIDTCKQDYISNTTLFIMLLPSVERHVSSHFKSSSGLFLKIQILNTVTVRTEIKGDLWQGIDLSHVLVLKLYSDRVTDLFKINTLVYGREKFYWACIGAHMDSGKQFMMGKVS
jgi:hypothetical protein